VAISVVFFGLGMMKTVTGTVDWDTDTFKLTLHTATYTPNVDTHDFYDDATNELSTASGYTSGGVTLASVAVTYDTATDQIRMDCADPSWTFSAGVTWRYGVIRKARGGAASADEVLALLDWGTSQTVSTAYTLTIDPVGILYIDTT
jgi:hypothetical protein